MVNNRLLFIVSCAAILFFGMAITTLGSVLPHLKSAFNLDDIGAGTLFSILPFGILAGSLIFGPIADRYGYKLMLSVSCFLMTIGFGGIALSPTVGLLQFCIFLFGLGGGAINGGTSALVSDISVDRKGARLSILGVFFGVGALGMPFILGVLEKYWQFNPILLSVGMVTLLTGVIFLTLRFPPAKQAEGLSVSRSLQLFRDPFLLMVSFFLFFQSALEGLINNWTPAYLTGLLHIENNIALYILSASVAGMTVMRIFLGSLLKNWRQNNIWSLTFSLLLGGLLLVHFGNSIYPVLAGFICCGAGLAAGFPIMLGYLGDRFKDLSGTAFSFAFSVALAGNMLINYAMGVTAQYFGIKHLTTFGFAEFVIMALLCVLIIRMHTRKTTAT